jgi:hypothetical protein
MKKINPILISSILLLSASAQANMPVGGYSSEPRAKSGASVAWFGIKKGDSPGGDAIHAGTIVVQAPLKFSNHKNLTGSDAHEARQIKESALRNDKKLRKRAEMEYSQRHTSSKWR